MDWYDPKSFPIPCDIELIVRGKAKQMDTEEGLCDVLFEPTAWKPVEGPEPQQKKDKK